MLYKKTPYYSWHKQNGAKFYEKNEWLRVLHYGDPLQEYLACRKKAAIFDVDSMGKISVKGNGAATLLNWACTNDIGSTEIGKSKYTAISTEAGGVFDDMFVYRLDKNDFYIITNTFSREKVTTLLSEHAKPGTSVVDATRSISYLSVQGPASRDFLKSVGVTTNLDTNSLPYTGLVMTSLQDVPIKLCRTGYTGELGYELNFPSEYAIDLWTFLCEAGESEGIIPAGGDALMRLRTEKGYRSYGTDINEDTNLLESGLGWLVDWTKDDFLGKNALHAIRERGVERQQVYFLGPIGTTEIAIGDIFNNLGSSAGKITTALYSPLFERVVGLVFVNTEELRNEHPLLRDSDGIEIEVIKQPIYDPERKRLRQ